jgi:hypothetical protein
MSGELEERRNATTELVRETLRVLQQIEHHVVQGESQAVLVSDAKYLQQFKKIVQENEQLLPAARALEQAFQQYHKSTIEVAENSKLFVVVAASLSWALSVIYFYFERIKNAGIGFVVDVYRVMAELAKARSCMRMQFHDRKRILMLR